MLAPYGHSIVVWEGISLQPVVLRKHGLGLWDTDMSRYFIFRVLLVKHSEFFTHIKKISNFLTSN